ncbi:hypothetical protein [Corynebacterium meitnerae]|uniref:Terminal beta-(1->2)-arabinofuranosyltransferase C-terminal domain-containing protein n=1 Tax=Corynebacterium meitnerae TaxID=2913498 RepID=A0A9X3LVS8_9CORY|nr:hypothetical protein [Corynebacterium meitnerae]MCZ9294719.1 hypothetical protein [Corynebacterium meitnerae]
MEKSARLSLLLSALVAGAFAFWGGFSRRWMSDDGLIVLRTVRNILAGNGPVFNIGERVEANTSTLWQYLIVAFSWVPGMRLEDVAMWLALIFTVIAAVVGTIAAGKLWGQHMVLPFGIIIYLALPPARDFATSGLEWGLSLAWLAVWFALLVRWAEDSERTSALYWLAFWAGLSWLVRPELALYGGLTGVLLLALNRRNWRRIGGILAAALPLPGAYEIFRMGYYGLLTPHTAVAKSASESAWRTGAVYVWDTMRPYGLWLPLIVAFAFGAWFVYQRAGKQALVAILAFGCGALHLIYVVKVGGDFMHGRMVLLPLFAMLLPVMAVPLTVVTGVATTGLVIWAGLVIQRSHDLGFDPFDKNPITLTIVDEREFWTAVLLRESGNPPRYAEDFLASDMMTNWTDVWDKALIDDSRTAALSLILVQEDPNVFQWEPRARMTGEDAQTDLGQMPITAYHVNLGMTGMNASLDARVLDSVGLTTPLAARQPREPGGRIGHDKHLPLHWQMADTGVDVEELPEYVDKQLVRQARAALRTPEINELLATYREPMSAKRFVKNMGWALTKGRTMEVNDNPDVYLDPDTLERIAAGEDVGLHGPRVYWSGQ